LSQLRQLTVDGQPALQFFGVGRVAAFVQEARLGRVSDDEMQSLGGGMVTRKDLLSALIGIAMAIALIEFALAADPAVEGAELREKAVALERAGKLAEAEDAWRKGIAFYEKTFSPTHLWVGSLLAAVGRVYIKQHRDAEAVPVIQQGLAIMEGSLGGESADSSLR
jgi:tetratricopeptide (TPR) repeat protein